MALSAATWTEEGDCSTCCRGATPRSSRRTASPR
uniref:Uncharacterized protein n=1 Tax=Arundo donax TaxID=35708 RepID=A0A0A9CIN5_ARUDO